MASIIKSDNGVSSGITGIVQSADSSGQLVLQTTTSSGTATTAVTIDNTQKVTFANSIGFGSNAGITFNNSSALTNSTLNDYETGTWTPQAGSDSGAYTATYSIQDGKYVKIGNRVWATFDIQLASRTQTGSVAFVYGLPFPVANNGDLSGAFGAPALTANQGSNFYQLAIYAQNNASFCYITCTTSNTSGITPISNAFWGTTTRLAGGVMYNTTF